MGRKKELPKLLHGQGSMSWCNDECTLVLYRKIISLADGSKKRIQVRAATPSEAMKLMKAEEEKISNQTRKEIKKKEFGTLEQNMQEWLNIYKMQDVNSKTYDRIYSTFTTHVQNSELGLLQEKTITSDDIQLFLNGLKKHNRKGDPTEEKLSYSSKKKVYELLYQYFRYKFMSNPNHNPMLRVIKPRKSDDEVLKENEELIIWDDDEMDKLTATAKLPYRVGIDGFKNGNIISFLLWSFCRVGECQALQWKDINFETKTITISKSYQRSKIRTGAKAGQYEYKIVPTKNKQKRQIKVCQNAIDSLIRYKAIKRPKFDDEYVCGVNGGILSLTSITATYKAMIKYSELPEDKHVTIHGLRHSGISYFLRHGVPVEVVSKMAGHSSIEITQNIYYQILESQKEKAINDLDSYINKKTK